MSATAGPSCHRGCAMGAYSGRITLATVITILRTVISVSLTARGAITGQDSWLFAGLGVYWVGDILDGAVARWTNRETRSGAVLDIISDRFCAGLFFFSYGIAHPSLIVPILAFLALFMVVDCYLSLAFLDWPLISSNYFGLVEETIYKLNWSPVAKALNSGAVIILIVVTQSVLAVSVAVAALAVVKGYSVLRLSRMPRPFDAACAVQAATGALDASKDA